MAQRSLTLTHYAGAKKVGFGSWVGTRAGLDVVAKKYYQLYKQAQ
jgi:hypothetical protein